MMNTIVKPITPDGRTGFDQYDQLMTWTVPDTNGYARGRIISDVRTHTCYICGRGWENTTESLCDQVAEDDMFMHQTCYFGHRKLAEKRLLTDALIKADFLCRLEEVPPRYPHSTPWQRVSLLKNDQARSDSGFKIVLGSRKRVWEVRLHAPIEYLNRLQEKTKDYPETNGFRHESSDDPDLGSYFFLHAWSMDQLIEFLKLFQSVLPEDFKGGRFSSR